MAGRDPVRELTDDHLQIMVKIYHGLQATAAKLDERTLMLAGDLFSHNMLDLGAGVAPNRPYVLTEKGKRWTMAQLIKPSLTKGN